MAWQDLEAFTWELLTICTVETHGTLHHTVLSPVGGAALPPAAAGAVPPSEAHCCAAGCPGSASSAGPASSQRHMRRLAGTTAVSGSRNAVSTGQGSMHNQRPHRITNHASQLTCSMSAMDFCRMTGLADTPVPPLRARRGFSGTCWERASCMAATLFTLPACRGGRAADGPHAKGRAAHQNIEIRHSLHEIRECKAAAQKAEGHAANVPACTPSRAQHQMMSRPDCHSNLLPSRCVQLQDPPQAPFHPSA